MHTDIFCQLDAFKHNIIHESKYSYILMDEYPATLGHLLVIPKKHYDQLLHIPNNEYQDLMTTIREAIHVPKNTFNTLDYNIVYCEGKNAGQSIYHVHWHIVPREHNDTIIIDLNEKKSKKYYTDIRENFIKIMKNNKI